MAYTFQTTWESNSRTENYMEVTWREARSEMLYVVDNVELPDKQWIHH